MKQRNIQQRTLDSLIAGGISFLVSFIQSFLFVPFFLKYWGNEKYSIWITLYAFITLIRTIDLGHSNYVGNEFNRLFYQNPEEARNILGSSMRVAFCLGLFEVSVYVVILFLGLHGQLVGIDLATYPVSGGIIALLLMWMLVGTTSGILVRIILPFGRYSRVLYLGILIKIIELICMIICVYYQRSINTLCYALSVSWLIYSVFVFIDIRNMAPAFYPWWKNGSIRHGFQNLSKSIILTFNGFVEQFNTNGLILIISKSLAITQVPVFTTIRTLTNLFIQATSLVLNPLLPDIIRYHATGEKNKIRKVIDTNWFISGILVNIPFLLIVPFIEWFYAWWTKDKLQFNLSLFYELAVSVAIINFGKPYMSFLTGINHLRALSIITATRFVLIFGLSIFFLKWQGLTGIGLAILVAELVSSGVLPCLFTHRELEKHAFLWDGHLLAAASQIAVLGAYYWQRSILPVQNLWIFSTSLGILIGISFLQWKYLAEDVKSRLYSLNKVLFFKRRGFK